jgi:PAS domain S-box-containing protein
MDNKFCRSVTELSVDQLANIVNFIPDAVLAVDLLGRVIIWNNAMEEMTGFTADEMIGRGNYEYALPFYGFRRPILIDMVRMPDQGLDSEYKNLQRIGDTLIGEAFIPSFGIDGSYIWSKAAPLYDSDGDVVGAIESIRDITEHKRVEEALRDSKSKLAAIIDFLPDATFVIDDKKTVIAWNRAMEEMTGVSKESMIGQGDHAYTVPFYGKRRPQLLDLLDMDDEDLASKYKYVGKKGNTLFAETYTPALNDGKGAYVWATGAPIFDDQGNRTGAIESIRDITEQKRAERTLREQLNFLQQLIDAIPSPIFYKDTDCIYLGCNKAFETITRLAKDSIVGHTVYELYPSDLADIYHEADLRLLQNPGAQSYEAGAVSADGRRLDIMLSEATYFDTKGRLSGIVGIILDITERKQMENALRESERRLADIIDFLPDSTFVIDREGKVIAWNRAIELLTGIRAEDMLGKGSYEYSMPFYGERRPILIDLVLRPAEEMEREYSYLKREGSLLVGEAYMPMLGGGEVYLWGVASALYDFQGNIVGAIESIKDITERKRSEEVLKASLQEKEVLIKEVHHRVKNNLQIVSSLLRLQSTGIRDRDALEAFKDCQNCIKSMALVHEKLYRSEDLSKLYLNDYINGLAADLIRSFRSERKVKFCPHLMKVLLGIDKAIPFGLILSELITNCIRHAFPGDGTGEIHVSLILVEDHLELTVRDNGIGMPEDVNIDNVRSTGLMLVKTLVNQLKGTLEINVSCGTEFKIGIDI